MLAENQRGTSGLDNFGGAAADSRGNLYITGYSNEWNKNHEALVILKYDVEGKLAGERMYGKPGEDRHGLAIIVDDEGYIYVAIHTHRDHTANG